MLKFHRNEPADTDEDVIIGKTWYLTRRSKPCIFNQKHFRCNLYINIYSTVHV